MDLELEPDAVGGNPEVLDALKLLTEKATNNKEYCYIMAILCRKPAHYETMIAGAFGLEQAANMGVDVLKQYIMTQARDITVAQRRADQSAPANRVMFNLRKTVVNFDFVHWLINQEMTRVREGAPFPLRVQWFDGNSGQSSLNTLWRQQMFNCVLRPMLALVGAVEETEAVSARLVEDCSLVPAVEAYRAGEPIPKFSAPPEILKMVEKDLWFDGKRPVTITLREAEHVPYRNNNLPEWVKLAKYLESKGHPVLFIRDTAKAMEPLDGFKTCPPASIDLLVRAAVYQLAKANLCVANGPAMLTVFTDTPWLWFNEVRDGHAYRTNTSEGWYAAAGINPPEQWPWAKPNQRIIWKLDTFETMRDAWEEHIAPTLGD